MASFTTHISTSTLLGAGYAAVGHYHLQMPLDTSLVAGGLCAIAGILPDVDSDSGRPVREIMGFAAAIVPLLLLDRLRQAGLTHDAQVLAGGLTYLFVRFGLGGLLKRMTVHRGMWHSIPAAIIAGLVTSLLCGDQSVDVRLFKVIAVSAGYFSHLLLDELYSVSFRGGRPRLKRSFGTAMKLYGKSTWGNISIYSQLVFIAVLAFQDPTLSGPNSPAPPPMLAPGAASEQNWQTGQRNQGAEPSDGRDAAGAWSWRFRPRQTR